MGSDGCRSESTCIVAAVMEGMISVPLGAV